MPGTIASRECRVVILRCPLAERDMDLVHVAAWLYPVLVAFPFAHQQPFHSDRRRRVDEHDEIGISDKRVPPTIEGPGQNPPVFPLLLTDESDTLLRRAL